MLKYSAEAFLIAGCLFAAATGWAQTPSNQAGAATQATVHDIVDKPDQWYGKTVTVRGKVDDVFGRTLFDVETEGPLGFDDDLLVVVPRPDSIRKSDEWITITGTVRPFVRTEIERTYSGTDWSLPDEVMVQFEREPSIVATRVSVQTDRAVGTAGSSTTAMQPSIENIAEHPDQWYGKTVTVRGRVDDIFHRGVFELKEGGFLADDEVLVVARTSAAAVTPSKDSWVAVSGVVTSFVDADVNRERSGDSRLPDEVTIQFEKRPTIVATSMTGIPEP
jgi:hypothetical protein